MERSDVVNFDSQSTGGTVDVQDLIQALDQRILDAIEAKATGETIVRLCEARAWLTNPSQAHVSFPQND
jgi:hypothetical protein